MTTPLVASYRNHLAKIQHCSFGSSPARLVFKEIFFFFTTGQQGALDWFWLYICPCRKPLVQKSCFCGLLLSTRFVYSSIIILLIFKCRPVQVRKVDIKYWQDASCSVNQSGAVFTFAWSPQRKHKPTVNSTNKEKNPTKTDRQLKWCFSKLSESPASVYLDTFICPFILEFRWKDGLFFCQHATFTNRRAHHSVLSLRIVTPYCHSNNNSNTPRNDSKGKKNNWYHWQCCGRVSLFQKKILLWPRRFCLTST